MNFTYRLRTLFAFGCIFAIFLVAGCAHPSSAKALNDQKIDLWTGRISLLVKSEPEQFFSAGFELKGSPDRGELSLTSPLGNVLGQLRWSPGEAQFDSGSGGKGSSDNIGGKGGNGQRFDSVDALMIRTTGAAVPLPALFGWLQGDNFSVNGWSADLSRYSEGRIFATRIQPQPPVELRIVLDR